MQEDNSPKKIRSFTDLTAWKEAHKLVVSIYRITQLFPKEEMFGLTSQIRRAVISITSNIAEGFSRQSSKEKIQFYSIALGSLTELQNQLLAARDVGFLPSSDFQEEASQTVRVRKLILGLIRGLRHSPNTQYPIRNTENGSIFLEVLLTLAVTAVAAVGLILTLLFAIQLGLRAHWETTAGELGHQALEIVRHTPFDALPIQTDGPLLGNPAPPASDLPQGTATLTIRNYLSQTDLREALVVVTYTEGGRTRTLQFSTLVASGGLND